MSDPIPVSPRVLEWARQRQGMSVADVAEKLKRDTTEIEAWERGDSAPTYAQLETLAYKVYKRPLALFFFPEPPEEDGIEQAFRTLPEAEISRIPPRIRFLLRKAQVLQLNLVELYEAGNPAEDFLLRKLDFQPQVHATEMAQAVREAIGISLDQQSSWSNTDEALKIWRDAIEERGVFVFKDSFNSPGRKRPVSAESYFSGFCLYHGEFPLIYVNNNKPKTRQIFTLFHELGHLFMHTGGVDTPLEDYEEFLTGDDRRIEVLCNEFAAEFLVPSWDFEARSSRLLVNDDSLSTLADQYRVSREVVLRRFLDLGRIDQGYYESKVAQWTSESRESRGSSGNYYATQGTYLGTRYIERVFSRYHQNLITLEQAADYLVASPKNLAGLEAVVFRHGEAS